MANPRIERGSQIPALKRRRLLEKLELLCSCGAGIEAIAPNVCEIVGKLLETDAMSAFWTGLEGQPSGFFHDSAPVEVKDFFVSNFDELFSSPDEVTMVGLLKRTDPSIGKFLAPCGLATYRASNVYKYLSGPLGHEYFLDIRIDDAAEGRVLFGAWNCAGRPFTAGNVLTAKTVQGLVSASLGYNSGRANWQTVSRRTAHLITDCEGQTLLAIDEEAEKRLQEAHLLRQNISMRNSLARAPLFVVEMARQLKSAPEAELTIPISGGRLLLRAVRSSVRTKTLLPDTVFISLEAQQVVEVQCIDALCSFPITMLQKRLACFAIQGGERQECRTHFGISEEALKKHLKVVYATLGVAGWAQLREWPHYIGRDRTQQTY